MRVSTLELIIKLINTFAYSNNCTTFFADVAVSVFVYTILIIFVLAPPLIIILIVIIIVVCCKKKKNTNKSVKQEYAAGENPSHSNWTPPTPRSPEHHEMRKVSSEFADAGHSTLGPLGTTKHYHMNMRP